MRAAATMTCSMQCVAPRSTIQTRSNASGPMVLLPLSAMGDTLSMDAVKHRLTVAKSYVNYTIDVLGDEFGL